MNDSAKHCAEHPTIDYKCRECRLAYQRWHYRNNKQTYKEKSAKSYQENKEYYLRNSTANARKRRFGVTQEDFDKMLEQQDNKCVICYTALDQSACVDHCHTTGVVRGLLCRKCNAALGLFNDDPEAVGRAKQYLEKNKS